jgi:hypothetical protein
MSQQTLADRTIRLQNDSNFELDINSQPLIFKKKLLEKILDPPQEDHNIPRTTTVKCLFKYCQ